MLRGMLGKKCLLVCRTLVLFIPASFLMDGNDIGPM